MAALNSVPPRGKLYWTRSMGSRVHELSLIGNTIDVPSARLRLLEALDLHPHYDSVRIFSLEHGTEKLDHHSLLDKDRVRVEVVRAQVRPAANEPSYWTL